MAMGLRVPIRAPSYSPWRFGTPQSTSLYSIRIVPEVAVVLTVLAVKVARVVIVVIVVKVVRLRKFDKCLQVYS